MGTAHELPRVKAFGDARRAGSPEQATRDVDGESDADAVPRPLRMMLWHSLARRTRSTVLPSDQSLRPRIVLADPIDSHGECA